MLGLGPVRTLPPLVDLAPLTEPRYTCVAPQLTSPDVHRPSPSLTTWSGGAPRHPWLGQLVPSPGLDKPCCPSPDLVAPLYALEGQSLSPRYVTHPLPIRQN